MSAVGHPAEWWRSAFGPDYLRVYRHRDEAGAAEEARAWIGAAPGVERGARVIDLGCGAGRHLLALREAGVRALGVDLSPELLAEAARRGAGPVARADLRALPFRAAAFDAALCFFTSFGYFEDEADDARVLGEAARVLRGGGSLVLDLPDPGHVRAHLVPRTERSVGAESVVEERRLVEGGRRVEKTVTLRGPRGERGWRESVRLYEPGEVERLAAPAGWEPWARRAGHGGPAWSPGGGPRCVVVLRRTA